MRKKRFAAWITLDDGSRLAVTRKGAFAYCTEDRDAHLAYAALSGEAVFHREHIAPADARSPETSYPSYFIRAFAKLWKIASYAEGLDYMTPEEAEKWVRADFASFLPTLLAARRKRAARQVARRLARQYRSQMIGWKANGARREMRDEEGGRSEERAISRRNTP